MLAISFLLLMSAVHPKAPRLDDLEPADGEATSYVPSREEGLTVLFVGISADALDAGTFLLVRFDPAQGSVPIVAFPPETQVRNGEKVESLATIYRYGGAALARDALARTLGVPVDRYVRMDVTSFLAAAAAVGSVEFDLPREIVLEQGGGVTLTLNPGLQLLDGPKAAAIIRYRGYEGGEPERCATLAALTAAVVNQRMDIVLAAAADKIFEVVINAVDTDISYADYDDRKEAAAFLARLGKQPASPIEVAGEYGADGEYHLSDTFVALLTRVFV